MILTSELLAAGRTDAGGYNRAQVAALDVEWPLKSGWLTALIGKEVTDAAYRSFVRLGKTGRAPSIQEPEPNELAALRSENIKLRVERDVLRAVLAKIEEEKT